MQFAKSLLLWVKGVFALGVLQLYRIKRGEQFHITARTPKNHEFSRLTSILTSSTTFALILQHFNQAVRIRKSGFHLSLRCEFESEREREKRPRTAQNVTGSEASAVAI